MAGRPLSSESGFFWFSVFSLNKLFISSFSSSRSSVLSLQQLCRVFILFIVSNPETSSVNLFVESPPLRAELIFLGQTSPADKPDKEKYPGCVELVSE